MQSNQKFSKGFGGENADAQIMLWNQVYGALVVLTAGLMFNFGFVASAIVILATHLFIWFGLPRLIPWLCKLANVDVSAQSTNIFLVFGFSASNINIKIPKGPVAHLYVRHVSISWVALSVTGVKIVLRETDELIHEQKFRNQQRKGLSELMKTKSKNKRVNKVLLGALGGVAWLVNKGMVRTLLWFKRCAENVTIIHPDLEIEVSIQSMELTSWEKSDDHHRRGGIYLVFQEIMLSHFQPQSQSQHVLFIITQISIAGCIRVGSQNPIPKLQPLQIDINQPTLSLSPLIIQLSEKANMIKKKWKMLGSDDEETRSTDENLPVSSSPQSDASPIQQQLENKQPKPRKEIVEKLKEVVQFLPDTVKVQLSQLHIETYGFVTKTDDREAQFWLDFQSLLLNIKINKVVDQQAANAPRRIFPLRMDQWQQFGQNISGGFPSPPAQNSDIVSGNLSIQDVRGGVTVLGFPSVFDFCSNSILGSVNMRLTQEDQDEQDSQLQQQVSNAIFKVCAKLNEVQLDRIEVNVDSLISLIQVVKLIETEYKQVIKEEDSSENVHEQVLLKQPVKIAKKNGIIDFEFQSEILRSLDFVLQSQQGNAQAYVTVTAIFVNIQKVGNSQLEGTVGATQVRVGSMKGFDLTQVGLVQDPVFKWKDKVARVEVENTVINTEHKYLGEVASLIVIILKGVKSIKSKKSSPRQAPQFKIQQTKKGLEVLHVNVKQVCIKYGGSYEVAKQFSSIGEEAEVQCQQSLDTSEFSIEVDLQHTKQVDISIVSIRSEMRQVCMYPKHSWENTIIEKQILQVNKYWMSVTPPDHTNNSQETISIQAEGGTLSVDADQVLFYLKQVQLWLQFALKFRSADTVPVNSGQLSPSNSISSSSDLFPPLPSNIPDKLPKKKPQVNLSLIDFKVSAHIGPRDVVEVQLQKAATCDPEKFWAVSELKLLLNQAEVIYCGEVELGILKRGKNEQGLLIMEGFQSDFRRDKFDLEMKPFSEEDIKEAYQASRLGQWCQGEDGAQITIDILAKKAVYIIPYHESPGRIIQYAQLWGKAVKQVLQDQIETVVDSMSKLSKKTVQKTSGAEHQKKSKTVQIQVRATDLGLRFLQHEFEGELALVLNQVLETTTQYRAWEAAIDSHKRELHTVDKEGTPEEGKPKTQKQGRHRRILSFGSGDAGSKSRSSDSPVGGQPLLSADELRSQESDIEVVTVKEQPLPVQELLRMKLVNDLSLIHGKKVQLLRKERDSDPLTRFGCAMSVKVDTVRAVLVIRDVFDKQDRAEAYDFIDRVDPVSSEVEMERMQMIHVWARVNGAIAHVAGQDTPMAEVAKIEAKGAIVMARQLCSPPMSRQLTAPVGRWHRVYMHVSKKGCKPPLKAYTDIDADLDHLNFNFSIGMEPAFALMAQASKRFVPPPSVEGDGELPPPDGSPILQWWDRMRYMWRGRAGVSITRLDAVLAVNIMPEVSVYEQRLQLMVADMKAKLEKEITVNLYGMRGKGFRKQDHCNNEPGFLEEFNYGDLNHVEMKFFIKWQMHQGRNSEEHHIFPIHKRGELEPPSSEPQSRVEVFEQFRGSAWTFDIFGTVFPPDDSDDEMPWAVLGEHQVRFIKEMVRVLTSPGIPVRGASRRGDYYYRKPPSSSIKGLSLNSMMRKVNVDINIPQMDVMHMSVAANDPSDGIRVAVNAVRLVMEFDYFRIPHNYMTSAGFMRQKTRMRQHMSHLGLDVFEVKGYRKIGDDMPLALAWAGRANSDPLRELLGGGDQEDEEAESPKKGPSSTPISSHQYMVSDVRQGEAFLLYIGSLVLRQTSQYRKSSVNLGYSLDGEELPPDRSEPLKIIVEDLKALMPVEARNAIYGIAIHMANAFVPRKKDPDEKKQDKEQELTPPLQTELQESESEVGGEDLLSIIQRENSKINRSRTSRRDAGAASETASSLGGERSFTGRVTPDPGNKEEEDEEQPIVTHEIEFARIQVNIEAPEANGFFLLSVDRGHLVVKLHPVIQEKVLNFNMDHVQGFITYSDVDPENSIQWLVIEDGRLLKPKDNTYSIQVLRPFSMKLRQLTSMGGSDLGTEDGQQGDHGGESQLLLGTLNLQADMNSREFEILLDVISNNLMLQMPKIDILAAHVKRLEADRYDEVLSAKDAVKVARAELSRVRAQAHLLAILSGEKVGYESHTPLHEQILSVPSLRHQQFYPNVDGMFSVQQEELSFAEFLPMLGIKLREAHRSGGFQYALDRPTGDGMLDGNLGGIDACPLLMRWLDGEEVKILEVLEKVVDMHEQVQSKFQTLVERSKKIAAQAWSSQLVATVANISWNLRNQTGQYFVQAFIQKITFDTLRNKDNSGQTSLVVEDIRVVQMGNEEQILAQWNPSESYKREHFFQGIAVLDKPTEEEVIYSMLEMKVHPLKVHLTEALAKQIQEYFFPKALEASERQSIFEKSIYKGRKQQLSPPPSEHTDLVALSQSQHVGREQELSTSPNSTYLQGHQRGVSIDSAFDSVPVDQMGQGISGVGRDSTVVKSNTSRQLAQQSRRSTVAGVSPSTSQETTRKDTRQASKKPKYVRKIRFVNVNLNRCHIMLTFQATAFSLTNKKIVIDECVYNQLKGRWKDLFSKLKGNVISSVLKSVVGLQYKKIDKLKREGDIDSMLANPGAPPLQKNSWGKKLFGKKRVEGEALLEGDEVLPDDEQEEASSSSDKDKKKRLQLLGTLGKKT